METSLRERRKRQTRHEIQGAAISLALEHGLDAVTTEMISQRAGISVRTFFNYYQNKIAAIIGDKPRFEGDYVDTFRQSDGPLADDLKSLLCAHLRHVMLDSGQMKNLVRLMRAEPKLREVNDHVLESLREDLTALVVTRLPACQARAAVFIAETLIGFIKIIIEEWYTHPGPPLTAHLEERWPNLVGACASISAT